MKAIAINNFLDFTTTHEEKAPDWWNQQYKEFVAGKNLVRQKLTFISEVHKGYGRYECECGKNHIARIKSVTSGATKSCGCQKSGKKTIEWHKLNRAEKSKKYYEKNKVKLRKEAVERMKKLRDVRLENRLV